MRVRIVFLLFLFTTALVGLKAQDCTLRLSGIVSDRHDNEPLEYATVFIRETRQYAETDSLGKFILTNICPGKYHFSLSHLGCETRDFFIGINQDTLIDFILDHSHNLLDEVKITAKDAGTRTALAKNTITSDQLAEMAGKSISDIVRTVPGVSTLRSGPGLSKPVIHGLYGNRITILNNGIPQEGQQWGLDHAPEIDPGANDKVTVVRGPSAIKYGLQAIGGIITVEPELLERDPHLHGTLKINGQSNGRMAGANLTLRKSMGRYNSRIYGGINYGGDRHTPEYYLTNTGTREYSTSVLISSGETLKHKMTLYYNYFHTINGILRGSHIGNLTDLEQALVREKPFFTSDSFSYRINNPRQQVGHHLFKYKHNFRIGESSRLEFTAAIQANARKEFDVRRAGRSDLPALDLLLFNQYSDLAFFAERQKWSLTAGVQYRYGNNTNIPGTGISPLIPDYISHSAAFYTIAKRDIGGISAEAGFRAEYRNYDSYLVRPGSPIVNAGHNFLNIATNAGLKKTISEKAEVRMDISYTQRPPEINELYSNGLHQSVSGIEEGDPDLASESSWKIVNEWNLNPSGAHQLNIALFYHLIDNYIYLEPTQEIRLTVRGAFPVFRYTGSNVQLAGINAKWKAALTDALSWSNSFNYVNARNLSQNTGLVRTPPFQATSLLTLNLGKSAFYNELKTGLEVTYTAMQTNVAPDEDFLPPPPGYTLINANVRAKWKTKNRRDLDLLIRCENILDLAYRDYLNRLRYFADEQGRTIYITLLTKF